MVRILDILTEFLKEMEKDNPFNLVLKGGTALSIYYLNHHRESEDLDFDAEKSLIKKHEKIKNSFVDILEKLKERQLITEYIISKSGFASANRYHIKLELKTYKTFYTKIDIDFVELPKRLIKKGALCLYPAERIFITKAVTFVNRKEFKDIYDISHLTGKIDVHMFKKGAKVANLINNVIGIIQSEDIKELYKIAFKNVDLKFKDLKEHDLNKFLTMTLRKLNILVNKLNK